MTLRRRVDPLRATKTPAQLVTGRGEVVQIKTSTCGFGARPEKDARLLMATVADLMYLICITATVA